MPALTSSSVASHSGCKVAVKRAGRTDGRRDTPMFCCPPEPAAVDQRHARMSVRIEHPPQTSGKQATPAIVDDHARPVGDAEPTHDALELRRSQHEARRIRAVADRLGIEPYGLGDVPAVETLSPHIKDSNSRILRVRGHPSGAHELLGMDVADSGCEEQGMQHGDGVRS